MKSVARPVGGKLLTPVFKLMLVLWVAGLRLLRLARATRCCWKT